MLKLINKEGLILYKADNKERFYKVVQETLKQVSGSYRIYTKNFKEFVIIY